MKRTMMFAAVMSVVVTFAAVTAMSANAVSLTGQNKPVTIRRASSSPFEDGKRVESVWSRADTLSGFVVPGCMDAAIDDAAVQFLYDDDFLYVSLRGYFQKGCAKRPVDRRLFRDNNFEIFLSPSKEGKTFRQFAFSQDGLVYYGDCNDGAKRELRRPEELGLKILESDGCTTFNVKLPASSVGLDGIRDGGKIAIFVARRNLNFKDDYREDSVWGAMPENFDYGCMKYWGEARFSRDDGATPVTVFSPHNNLKVNYFANPKFAVPDRSWQIVGKGVTLRRETMPMSREWIFRTTGDSYHFLKGVPQVYERDTEYTLEVRARAYGGDEAQMNILELYRRDTDGKICEGTSIAKHVILGKEFHTYYFPFRSTNKGLPKCMLFYKWEPKSDRGRGLDVASIRLFKGKVGALDIRKVARSGRKVPVDAGIPIAANPYGASAVKARGLVFNRHFRGRREVMELFEGTDVDVDVLSTTGLDQDIYMTDDDINAVKKHLAGREYDFYCILSSVAVNIGAEMSSAIIDGVRNGAGLYYMYNANAGHFEKLFSETSFTPLGSEHPLARAYPGNIDRSIAYIDPGKTFQEGRFGKGRVIREQNGRAGELKYVMNAGCYGITDFPFSRFADPIMLKAFLYVSGKDSADVSSAIKTIWSAVDLTGMVRKDGVASNVEEAVAQAKSACNVSGRYAVSLKSVNGHGRTVDWSARYFEKTGPRLMLKGERTSCSGDDPAVFTISSDVVADSAVVRWTLEDFSGRIIESGVSRPFSKIEVPTRALFTNKGVVRAYLEENGSVRAVARTDIYARDRDWQRFKNDFGVGIWGQGTAVSRDAYPIVDRQLERAGVLCQSLPIGYYSDGDKRNLTLPMSSGMAVGGGYLGESNWFYPMQIGESNNRSVYGPINTEKGRRKIAEKARTTAAAVAKYGPIAYTVCDEPNLSLRFTKDEPDEEPENVTEYRRRMERKYGTLAEYNRRHRTFHKSFADIGPVRLEDAR
ncbi:MAG: hypothetical protein IKK82_02880, partial [Kiritimatiellae bacterium]|nr:hypothetical protein [Kiritimatiellia bacterium]